uniref:Uncharacterized protein n=1 Tax=Rhizophora mucronata TaxID=61149 RepID=A0A2P2N2E9_RHIMU
MKKRQTARCLSAFKQNRMLSSPLFSEGKMFRLINAFAG